MDGGPRNFLCLEKTSTLGHVELEGLELLRSLFLWLIWRCVCDLGHTYTSD